MVIKLSLMCLIMWALNYHPMILTLILVIQTLPIVYLIWYSLSFVWLVYLMILIFLSGLLIIFVYLSSLVPNELFFLNEKIMIIFLTSFFYFNIFINYFSFNNQMYLLNFFYYNLMNMVVMMFFFLLVLLFVVVYLCSIYKFPLKQKF